MPINPKNRALYPANWSTEIRPRILARDGNCCRRCKVANYVVIRRGVLAGIPAYQIDGFRIVRSARDGSLLADTDAIDFASEGAALVRIVLTIAHLDDPNPSNCGDDNLAALCQRCHNVLDMPMRLVHARDTRRAQLAAGDLFECL